MVFRGTNVGYKLKLVSVKPNFLYRFHYCLLITSVFVCVNVLFPYMLNKQFYEMRIVFLPSPGVYSGTPGEYCSICREFMTMSMLYVH